MTWQGPKFHEVLATTQLSALLSIITRLRLPKHCKQGKYVCYIHTYTMLNDYYTVSITLRIGLPHLLTFQKIYVMSPSNYIYYGIFNLGIMNTSTISLSTSLPNVLEQVPYQYIFRPSPISPSTRSLSRSFTNIPNNFLYDICAPKSMLSSCN